LFEFCIFILFDFVFFVGGVVTRGWFMAQHTQIKIMYISLILTL